MFLLKGNNIQILSVIENDQSATLQISNLQSQKTIEFNIPKSEIRNIVNGFSKSINKISGDTIFAQSNDNRNIRWNFYYTHVEISILDQYNLVQDMIDIKRGQILALAGFLYDYMEEVEK